MKKENLKKLLDEVKIYDGTKTYAFELRKLLNIKQKDRFLNEKDIDISYLYPAAEDSNGKNYFWKCYDFADLRIDFFQNRIEIFYEHDYYFKDEVDGPWKETEEHDMYKKDGDIEIIFTTDENGIETYEIKDK